MSSNYPNTFVISLPISLDRRRKIKKILKNKRYVFFDASLGTKLNPYENKIKNKLFYQNIKLSEGEIGCFLSHFLLWKHITPVLCKNGNYDFNDFMN